MDYSQEKAHRIQQFAQILEPMPYRALNIAKGCCYVVIQERKDSKSDSRSLEASKVHQQVLSSSLSDSLDPSFDVTRDCEGWSDEGWRSDDKQKRFVQFVFYEKHFELDLPRPMLWPMEAQEILSSRTGFYFLRDRFRRKADQHDVVHYDPLRKPFVHGDNFAAAEEIAYLFFTLWHFPIDTRFYINTFGQDHTWDAGRPLV